MIAEINKKIDMRDSVDKNEKPNRSFDGGKKSTAADGDKTGGEPGGNMDQEYQSKFDDDPLVVSQKKRKSSNKNRSSVGTELMRSINDDNRSYPVEKAMNLNTQKSPRIKQHQNIEEYRDSKFGNRSKPAPRTESVSTLKTITPMGKCKLDLASILFWHFLLIMIPINLFLQS